jgi:uracil-DNA glycosylase
MMRCPSAVNILGDTVNKSERHNAFIDLAKDLPGVDVEVYQQYGVSPLEPVIGVGGPSHGIAIFGRDPGRDEVQHQLPFIGAGGQKVRKMLYQHRYGDEMPNFNASIKVGEHYFWANTVPYKPLGNKAWSMGIKKKFQPLVADLLVHDWDGDQIITLGREAFFWFAINQDRSVKKQLEEFWKREDRFTASIDVEIKDLNGEGRTLSIHPLPHPSPLNATWYKRFPALLAQRLTTLEPNVRLS